MKTATERRWSFMMLLSSVAIFMAAAGFAQTASSVAGVWNGAIETPGGSLKIVVTLEPGENGAWSGTIDIPQEGATAVPLAEIIAKLPDVSFRLANAPGDPTIRLTLSADSAQMSGTLTQGGAKLPVSLTRGPAQAAERVTPTRPQTPVRPVPYIEEDITFRNENAKLQLAGTLTLPRSAGSVPAVILITGSGQQDRDETLFDHKPFWVWADHLTRRGIAVLRVDDRGIGGSDRGPQGVTSADFADDARSGLTYLRGRKEIDPKRIGLIGHSEGAMLAAMVAANSTDVAFIVMLAGTGVPGDQILYSQAAQLFRGQGVSDDLIARDRSVRERVFAVLKTETDGKPNQALRQKLLEELESAGSAGSGSPDAGARQLAQALLKAGSQPWMRFFLAFDPRPSLTKVTCPVLAIGGERDVQVPPRENLPEIERALHAGGNKDVTVIELPALNHLFQTSTTGLPTEYGTIEETISPAVLKLASEWITKRVF